MWKMHEIREIIKLFEESSLEELKIDLEEAESKIFLKKQEGSALYSYEVTETSKPVVLPVAVKEASAPEKKEILKLGDQKPPVETKVVQEESQKSIDADDPRVFKIISPMVGTFYRAPSADGDPFVKIGDKVEKSSVVCILEAMKLFNEIEAEVNGEIVDVLVENGQLVEYGQPLFLVKTK